MTDPRTSSPSRITRRAALAATGAAAAVWLAPGAAIVPAHAQPSEQELMQEGPLPEKTLGEESAPNTIIEYSSMTCPHCARLHENVIPDLKSKYIETGQALYILREFPLDNLAFAASMLARCAEDDKYFPLVEVLYDKQEEWAFGEGDAVERLFKIAKQAGFTRESYEQCLRDQELLDGIAAIRKRAHEEFGVNSTPTLFVNGQMLKGAGSIEDVEELMNLEKEG